MYDEFLRNLEGTVFSVPRAVAAKGFRTRARDGRINAMRSAIDRSGRVVIPKPLRDKLGLVGGEELDVIEENGAIEIRPAARKVAIVDTDRGVVAVAEEPTPVLTAAEVRATLERIRR